MQKKFYDFKKLLPIIKQQKYKMIALENSSGERVYNYNTIKTRAETQLRNIETRLGSEIMPEGCYYVCCALSINKTHTPDRYAIAKGNVPEESIQTRQEPIVVHTKAEQVLSWEQALELHKELAELKSENQILKNENEILSKLVEEYEAELDEEEDDLEEGEENDALGGTVKFLKEQAPVIKTGIEEWFKIKNRELDLKEKEITGKPSQSSSNKSSSSRRVPIEPGSDEHLALIDYYCKSENDEKLDAELDKLQEFSQEKYEEVCKKLNLKP